MAVTKRIEFLRRVVEDRARGLEKYNGFLAEEWRYRGIDPDLFWRLVRNPRLCQVLGITFSHVAAVDYLEQAERALAEALVAPRAQAVQEEKYPLRVIPMLFGEAMNRCNFDVVEGVDVLEENFGAPDTFYEGDVSLIQMNRHLWPDEIEGVLAAQGKSWGNSAVLLAFAAKFPEIQRDRHILSGACAWIEAPGLSLRKFLRDQSPMDSAGTSVSVKHLEHLHLAGGRAQRSIGTTRIDQMNDQRSAGSTWILAVPK